MAQTRPPNRWNQRRVEEKWPARSTFHSSTTLWYLFRKHLSLLYLSAVFWIQGQECVLDVVEWADAVLSSLLAEIASHSTNLKFFFKVLLITNILSKI